VSWNPRALPDQAGKTFVVTGGNAGIGYFISEQLASTGAHVVIASRSLQKADAAIRSIATRVPGARVEAIELDLGSLESVRKAARELGNLERIDAIIENAGTVMPSKKRLETADGFEIMFGTNHLGHFLLTSLLLPALERTPGSRVVTMGSSATKLTGIDVDNLQLTEDYSSWKAYGQSKHATQSFGFELDRRLRAAGSSVKALVAHPGGGQNGNTPTREGVNEPSTGERMRAKLLFFVGGGKDTAAWSAVRAALDPAAQGGQYWGPRGGIGGRPALVTPVRVSHDPALGATLWRRSEQLIGQEFTIAKAETR
jgi:NAD(P)-dependent dehydrogenase (short-subunit alcohol dehydrogenase family)